MVFQHGLTGDHRQITGTFLSTNYRLITLECRGHGGSDLGPVSELSISTFADDVIALMDHLRLSRVSVAGISMGAAICAVLAARYPDRIRSVTLVRPAFHDKRMPEIQQVHSVVANYIDIYGTRTGLEYFKSTEVYEKLAQASPDNASSLTAMFSLDPNKVIPLLRMMTLGDPGFDSEAIKKSGIPFRVTGTLHDEIHPMAKAEAICRDLGLPAVDIAFSKTLDRDAYNRDVTDIVSSNIF
ncbi:alpha/beta fold hydrolase [Erwinia mallotivora]|uniref:alpha/beta fold hydrolase n=1 Tax=Erwinia mallotivora TaxID=69222 RepID=UPI0035E82DBC